MKVNAAPTALIRGGRVCRFGQHRPLVETGKTQTAGLGRRTGRKQATLSGADPGPAHLESEVFLHCAPWASRLLRLGPSPALSQPHLTFVKQLLCAGH